MWGATPYVTREGRDACKKFKYNGSDLSLVYANVLSPWAEFCVKTFVPTWMAYVSITLIGLSFIVVSYLAVLAYAPSMTESVPGWVCVLCAVCLFTYQTLDNMDGKQARRTGSSSPLGLLFDHGCDSLNAGVLSSMTFAAVLGTGSEGPAAIYLWMLTVIPFFVNTWEEFHIGKFVLPVVNGPSEGILLICFAFVLTAVNGGEMWANPFPLWPTMSNLDLVVVLGIISVVLTTGHQTRNVILHARENGRSGVEPLLHLAPLAWVVACAWGYFVFAHTLYQDYPRLVLSTLGLAATDFTSKVMVSHVCDMEFRPNLISLTATAVPLVNVLARHFLHIGLPASLDVFVLVAAFCVVLLELARFIEHAVTELCDALNIEVFRIKPIVPK